MVFDYFIKYTSQNTYENPVFEATWQFMVTPENNDTQEMVSKDFKTSIDTKIERSENGLGFETERIHCKRPFTDIYFEAEFRIRKKENNPYDFLPSSDTVSDYELLNDLSFKIDFEPYLRATELSKLPVKYFDIYRFDAEKNIFENLLDLNNWVYKKIFFKTGVTHVGTLLEEIIEKRHGVCQDFTHVFCAIARTNGVPSRYVSGYLHQGDGFFGDSQMHAWAEVYVPNTGWIGFDPTNNMLANHNHIKVAHGKDYNDCAPLKGVVYSTGKNFTKYEVLVRHNQQVIQSEQ